jgi:hypothetical protein
MIAMGEASTPAPVLAALCCMEASGKIGVWMICGLQVPFFALSATILAIWGRWLVATADLQLPHGACLGISDVVARTLVDVVC